LLKQKCKKSKFRRYLLARRDALFEAKSNRISVKENSVYNIQLFVFLIFESEAFSCIAIFSSRLLDCFKFRMSCKEIPASFQFSLLALAIIWNYQVGRDEPCV